MLDNYEAVFSVSLELSYKQPQYRCFTASSVTSEENDHTESARILYPCSCPFPEDSLQSHQNDIHVENQNSYD